MVVDNVSSYAIYAASTMNEWQFVIAVAEEADCLLLLDSYAYGCVRFGPVSTMIERDDRISALNELLRELEQVRRTAAQPADPEAAELSALEWGPHLAFDTPDAQALDQSALTALDEDDWVAAWLVFQPSVSVALLEWNAGELWHAVGVGETSVVALRLAQPIGHLPGQRTVPPIPQTGRCRARRDA